MIPTKTLEEIVTTVNNDLNEWHRRRAWKDRYVSVDVLRQKLQQRINELDKTIGITKSFADSRIEELEQLLVMLEPEEAKKP